MLSLPLVDVLKNRGISDLDRFLAPPSWSDMPSPFELEGIEPTVTQILHAIRPQGRSRLLAIMIAMAPSQLQSSKRRCAGLELNRPPTFLIATKAMALAMRWYIDSLSMSKLLPPGFIAIEPLPEGFKR